MGAIKLFGYARVFGSVVRDVLRSKPNSGSRPFRPVSKFSVIIPTFNESKRIYDAIQTVKRERHILDIIVSDGGSSDDTRAVAGRLGALVIQEKKGRGCQIHSGIQHCRGDIILILHGDCRLRYGILNHILARLNQDRKLIGGALGMRFDPEDIKSRLLARLNNGRARYLGIAFGDQSQFFRSEALPLIGGFPNQMLMEDVELSLRLKHQGCLCFIPRGVVVSKRRWERRGFFKNCRIVLSLLTQYLFERHLGPGDDKRKSYYQRYYDRTLKE